MSFLQPWWLLLVLLALPFIFWHARNPRSQVVPSLRLWQEISRERSERLPSPRRIRFRPDLSLWLHLLALAAVVLALAGPRPARLNAEHHIWILDTSASMSASGVGASSRWDLAMSDLRRGLGNIDAGKRGGPALTLLTTSPSPQAIFARAEDPGPVVNAVQSLRPSRENVAPAAEELNRLVMSVLRPEERTRITVLTDGPGSTIFAEALEGPIAAGSNVEVASYGSPAETFGFVAVRAQLVDPEKEIWRVEGEVVAYPGFSESLEIEASFERDELEGALPWARQRIAAGQERVPFSFETDFPGPGVLTLRLPDDPLPLDNTARIGIRAAPVPLRVVLAGEIPDTLTTALQALPGAQVNRLAELVASTRSFDLAVVGPGSELSESPAPTTLWLAGVGPGGARGPLLEGDPTPRRGSTRAGWSAVDDFSAGTGDFYQVPGGPGYLTLLNSDLGPLLQVHEQADGTDVFAAWSIGTTEWSREIGFARFIAELAARAAPRYGMMTDARCVGDLSCASLGTEPGVHLIDSQRIIWDIEAGPESDLREEGVEFGRRFEHGFPWPLLDRLLLAAAAAVLAGEALVGWLRGRLVGRAGTIPRLAAKTLAVLALAAAAAGVPAPVVQLGPDMIIVLDPWGMPNERQQADFTAAADAVVLAKGEGELVGGNGVRDSGTDPLGYDLESLLRLALAATADGGEVVVAGVGGDGSNLPPDLIASARRRSITVHAISPTRRQAEVWLAANESWRSLRVGEVVSFAPRAAGAVSGEEQFEAWVDGELLSAADPREPSFEWTAAKIGEHEIRVRVTGPPGDQVGNNEVVNLLNVIPAASAALVTSEEPPGVLPEILRYLGFEVRLWSPQDLPLSLDGFAGIDVVLLLDVPAVDLHPLRQESLERWVRERGGGVLVAGARQAFGPGGYLRTPLEDLSPLSARVPGEQPQAAIAFVLDRSGSMQQAVEGVSRLALAKEATIQAVELLHPESRVTIVVFDDVAHLLKPLGAPDDVAERLAPVTAGGGTNIYPAMEAAFEQLQSTEAEAKHMIVLTDGLAQPAPFEPLIETITEAGVTISTVAVGRGADIVLLEQIARRGQGVFHRSDDVRALPSILSQEAMLLSGNPVREGRLEPNFRPGRAAFANALPLGFPELQGYVRTTPKEEAEVHASTPEGDPLLASWRHGIGRVVALPTPLTGPWSGDLLESDFGRELLSQALRWMTPPVMRSGLNVNVVREGDQLQIKTVLVAEDGSLRENAQVFAFVIDPSGAELGPYAMAQVGVGNYGVTVDGYLPGRYEISVRQTDGAGATAGATFHVSYPTNASYGVSRSRSLAGLVQATGGRMFLTGEAYERTRVPSIELAQAASTWSIAALVLSALGLLAPWRRAPVARRSQRRPAKESLQS